jgi:hypothetical protein
VPNFWVYNPAYAQVQNERVFPNAWTAIMKDGLTSQAVADKAFKRVEEIFAKYPIAQGSARARREPERARTGPGGNTRGACPRAVPIYMIPMREHTT